MSKLRKSTNCRIVLPTDTVNKPGQLAEVSALYFTISCRDKGKHRKAIFIIPLCTEITLETCDLHVCQISLSRIGLLSTFSTVIKTWTTSSQDNKWQNYNTQAFAFKVTSLNKYKAPSEEF